MDNPLFQPTVTHKLYTERSVFIGTFLGGPLAGGFLLAQNFKALEQPGNASRTWIVTIFAFFFIVASAFVPLLDQLPPFVYSFAFCLAAHGTARRFQGNQIAVHRAGGGRVYGGGRAAVIGISCSLILIGLIFGLLYLLDPAVHE